MNTTNWSLVKRVVVQSKKYWFLLVLIFCLNLLAIPLVLLKPVALKVLIDSGFNNLQLPAFIRFFFPSGFDFGFDVVVLISVCLVLGVALLENLYTVGIWLLNTFTGERLVLHFRAKLFDHVQRLSLLHHDNTGTADTLYRIQYDAGAMKSFFINNLSPLITSVFTLIAMLIVMFSINVSFSLMLMCVIPPLVILVRKSSAKLKKEWKVVKENESSAMAVINEVLNAIRVVKSFGREDREGERFMSRADRAISGQLSVAKAGAWFYFIVGMLFAVITAIFIYVGAYQIRTGTMTLGELTLMLAYVAQIYGPIEKITRNINDIQSSLTSIERVYALMDKEKEFVADSHHVRLSKISGRFSIRDVSFAYSADKPVLSGISLDLNPGDRVGIIGSTGSGKSTLLSLISRFYDPTSGSISLDGRDIKQMALADYRQQFSFVLQESVLFSTSIAENIAYGRPDASMKEIIEAAKNANAHDFITKLPEGYSTQVGERGVKLSGGERQRISIARAFIKNAPILILDEPTSSVDVYTEYLIIEAIKKLISGRNTFLVTHRLDTLSMCNVILHLEKGELLEVLRDPQPEYLEKKRKDHLQTLRT